MTLCMLMLILDFKYQNACLTSVQLTPQAQQPIKAHQKPYFYYSPPGWECCHVSDHLVKLSMVITMLIGEKDKLF